MLHLVSDIFFFKPRTSAIIKKSFSIDEQELDELKKKEIDFLVCAIKSYMRCLDLSDEHDVILHRYVSSNTLNIFYKQLCMMT